MADLLSSLQSLNSLELGPSVNKIKSVVSSPLPLVGVETIGRALGLFRLLPGPGKHGPPILFSRRSPVGETLNSTPLPVFCPKLL